MRSNKSNKSEAYVFFPFCLSVCLSVCLSAWMFIYFSLLMLFTAPARSLNTAANIYTSDQHDEWRKFDWQ